MPIGTGIVYYAGDLILSQVSSSGNSFLETKLAAATSSLIYFDGNGRINSSSLSNITVGTASFALTASYLVPTNSYQITNLTASNISASGNISASVFVGPLTGSVFGTSSWSTNASTASFVSNAFIQDGNSFGTTATLGTNDANSLALETNGTTRMTINSNGQFGIGASPSSSPFSKFYITDTHNTSNNSSSLYVVTNQNQGAGATSGNDVGINSYYSVNGLTSSASQQNQAMFNQLAFNASGSYSGSYRAMRNGLVLYNTASFDTNANVTNTYLTNQIGAAIPNFSINNLYAGPYVYVAEITANTATGSISNLYGNYVGTPFGNGTAITTSNAFGVYIGAQKSGTNGVTNGYGFYQAGSTDLNIFAGKVRVGATTTPVNVLDVTGNISCSVITASFFGTSSWATSSLTASFLPVGNYNITSSWATSSLTASFLPVGNYNITSSWSTNAVTASFLPVGNYNITSSWATSSLTASYLVPANSYQITNLSASNISASGTIRALSLVETSTVEAKYNILPLGSQLDKVLQLNPVSFTYKLTNQPSIGLIAEEVGEIYPEFTSPDKDAVAYSKMVSVLIQSVKELKSIVDDQQKQINKLLNK